MQLFNLQIFTNLQRFAVEMFDEKRIVLLVICVDDHNSEKIRMVYRNFIKQ